MEDDHAFEHEIDTSQRNSDANRDRFQRPRRQRMYTPTLVLSPLRVYSISHICRSKNNFAANKLFHWGKNAFEILFFVFEQVGRKLNNKAYLVFIVFL